MVVVDSSAVLAILFGQPLAAALLGPLAADADRGMSIASYLEAGAMLAGRRRSTGCDAVLDEAGPALAPVDQKQACAALRARIRFGCSMGPIGCRRHYGVDPSLRTAVELGLAREPGEGIWARPSGVAARECLRVGGVDPGHLRGLAALVRVVAARQSGHRAPRLGHVCGPRHAKDLVPAERFRQRSRRVLVRLRPVWV
jgi:ribonuclease VapC